MTHSQRWGQGGSWVPKESLDVGRKGQSFAIRWFGTHVGLPWNLQSYLQQEVQLVLRFLRLQLWWLEGLKPL